MIHYHGTPITPYRVLHELAGRHFCVSYARPDNVETCHAIGQSVMLDNGAFSFWKRGAAVDVAGFEAWCEPWLEHRTTWAVIPDVIDGTLAENDALIERWPYGQRGAPVWHLHEPVERLRTLCGHWDRVCIGSSGEYADVGNWLWHRRMVEAFDLVCDELGRVPAWLHMLRGLRLAGGPYPFASVDSTNIGRNHNRNGKTGLTARAMADYWDARQSPARWVRPPVQLVFEESA